jgi:hypothetical protein
MLVCNVVSDVAMECFNRNKFERDSSSEHCSEAVVFDADVRVGVVVVVVVAVVDDDEIGVKKDVRYDNIL